MVSYLLSEFVEESRRRGKGKGGAFAILESEDLSQVTRGSRAPMKHFKSPFIGYSVDKVYDFYKENVQSRELFATKTFAILDDKTVSEKLCLLAIEVQGELKTLRSEFAPSLECLVPFEFSFMEYDGLNDETGGVITLALMEKWDAELEANEKRAKEQREQNET
ncbi:MAG: hypothetical protein M1837_005051 [Sclerophora amabilis]|nr:MAG: hypothetical protein M1837_005051 [Sclerophora amabilis]